MTTDSLENQITQAIQNIEENISNWNFHTGLLKIESLLSSTLYPKLSLKQKLVIKFWHLYYIEEWEPLDYDNEFSSLVEEVLTYELKDEFTFETELLYSTILVYIYFIKHDYSEGKTFHLKAENVLNQHEDELFTKRELIKSLGIYYYVTGNFLIEFRIKEDIYGYLQKGVDILSTIPCFFYLGFNSNLK